MNPEAPAAPVAQTQPPAAPVGTPPRPDVGFGNFFLLLAMLPLMYFLLIRPQQKQAKERKAVLEALKKNDQVLTIGGVYGTVMAVADDQVTLRIDESKDVRIRIARGSIQGVVKAKAPDAEAV